MESRGGTEAATSGVSSSFSPSPHASLFISYFPLCVYFSYHKKNLKHMMNEFLGILKRTMGIHEVMLVGYEKNAGIAMSMCILFAFVCFYIDTYHLQL